MIKNSPTIPPPNCMYWLLSLDANAPIDPYPAYIKKHRIGNIQTLSVEQSPFFREKNSSQWNSPESGYPPGLVIVAFPCFLSITHVP